MTNIREKLAKATMAGIDAASAVPMRWGVDDCGLWVGNIIREVLGYDPCAECRGRYETAIGARRVLGPKGLKGGIQRAARRHGWKRIDPSIAQPGDVGLVRSRAGKRIVLGTVICRAPGWFVGRGEAGFLALPAKQVVYCWSVLRPSVVCSAGNPAFAKHPLRPHGNPVAAHEIISTAIGLTALIQAGTPFAVGSALGSLGISAGMIGGAVVMAGVPLTNNYAAAALSE